MDTINNRTFEHRPISELMSIVKNDFRKFDEEGLIDDGTLIKTILYCNDKLGIPVREVKEVALSVEEYSAKLPLDFEKLYYACGIRATNTLTRIGVNPFDNNFDQDIIYDAHLDRGSIGCVDNYQVIIKRQTEETHHHYHEWIPLSISQSSLQHCHMDCPNKRKKGVYTIAIDGDKLSTPFRSGTIYIMYIGAMRNEDGEIVFPFHPMITPYYEWMIKEKILQDAIFNSDATNLGELYKLAQQERLKAWVDAYNLTIDKGYNEYVKHQRNKELSWYNKYFKHLQ